MTSFDVIVASFGKNMISLFFHRSLIKWCEKITETIDWLESLNWNQALTLSNHENPNNVMANQNLKQNMYVTAIKGGQTSQGQVPSCIRALTKTNYHLQNRAYKVTSIIWFLIHVAIITQTRFHCMQLLPKPYWDKTPRADNRNYCKTALLDNAIQGFLLA